MNYFSPINSQFFDANGNPLNAGKVYTYLAGTSTPATTYTTQSGTTPQSNPIILDSLGYMPNPLWLATGVSYKLVIQDSTGTTLKTFDNIGGVNDVSTPLSQWITFTGTATYISATQFSVTGDQTGIFSTGRRLQTTNSGGTIYSTITTGVYSAGITTVTVVSDAGGLDSGLSAVLYGVLTYVNTAMPKAQSSVNADNVTGTISSAVTATTQAANDNSTKVSTTAYADRVGSLNLPRSYLSGLTLSTAGSSGTMTIAAGQAVDSANVYAMSLASAISKTTSAWAVGSGAGGLDTGAIANSTWYYFYAIRRPDTGVVDVVFSLSSSTPTLPTSYTQYRYIGAGLTNGSAQWTKFTQFGDEFWWDTPVSNFSGAGSTTAVLLTLTLPRGRKMKALLSCSMGGGETILVTDPENADVTPGSGSWTVGAGSTITDVYGTGSVWTNTSAQIRYRCTSSIRNGAITTNGWLDLRGKNL